MLGSKLPLTEDFNGHVQETQANLKKTYLPEKSATEAQLGLAYEFEFEFDLTFNNRVQVRVSSSSFCVQGSRFEFRVSFRESVFGPFSGPFRDPFSVPFGIPERTRKGALSAVSQFPAERGG